MLWWDMHAGNAVPVTLLLPSVPQSKLDRSKAVNAACCRKFVISHPRPALGIVSGIFRGAVSTRVHDRNYPCGRAILRSMG
jgi:hypothetical protein